MLRVSTGRARRASAAALVAALTLLAPAPALAATTIARWPMNEGRHASTMHDATSNGIDGRIGDHVRTGYRHGGARGYKWPYLEPNQPPADREHLVTVSDSRLNPGRRAFAVTIRFRTTRDFGNIIQKGQSGTAGGYFKWQIPDGRLTCLFRGVVHGRFVGKAVNSGRRRLNDGAWHTVTCRRTHHGLTMRIDGRRTRRASGWTGRISNTKVLSIGGKYNCDQQTVTCDYFAGAIDFVEISAG